jgi:hypothetical protein
MTPILVSDLAAALGLPFASAADESWARLAVDAANTFAAGTPHATDPALELQVRAGTVMVAAWLYRRRPAGTVMPGFEFTPTSDEVTAFYTLLGLGRHQPPVVA